MIKRVLLAIAAFTASVSCTLAADLPVRPAYTPSQIMSPVSVYNWTGIYVGINGGYTFGNQDPLSLFSTDFNTFNIAQMDGCLAERSAPRSRAAMS